MSAGPAADLRSTVTDERAPALDPVLRRVACNAHDHYRLPSYRVAPGGTLTQSGAGTPGPVEFYTEVFDAVTTNVARVLFEGKDEPVRLTLMCMAAGGHMLLEDVPGVGKTTLAKALAHSLGLEWHRIQFTPDLLPSDVTGVNVFEPRAGQLPVSAWRCVRQHPSGRRNEPGFPKDSAALLEAMQEGQVTVDSTSHALPLPFWSSPPRTR